MSQFFLFSELFFNGSYCKRFLPERGFTLIEMMVSIAIFTGISGVVLFNYNGFNSRILLNNLAYDVALSMRQAQVYGVGVREISSNTPPFGIFIDEGASNEGQTNYYIFFSDLGGTPNNAFDGSTSDCTSAECIQRYLIQRGNKVRQFCIWAGAVSTCSAAGASSLQSLTVLFKRPNPDARFYARDESAVIIPGDRATIQISDPAETIVKTITILNTGQISVN